MAFFLWSLTLCVNLQWFAGGELKLLNRNQCRTDVWTWVKHNAPTPPPPHTLQLGHNKYICKEGETRIQFTIHRRRLEILFYQLFLLKFIVCISLNDLSCQSHLIGSWWVKGTQWCQLTFQISKQLVTQFGHYNYFKQSDSKVSR
jgi:hypothetical protein